MAKHSRIILSVVALFAAAVLTIPLQAGVIYSTGFENPPFTTGNLTGQDGWQVFGAGTPQVETTLVKSGTQAVEVQGNTGGQTGPFHSDATSATMVDLSADIYLASGTSQSEWQFAGLGGPGLGPFIGGIDTNPINNTVFLITNGFPTVGNFTRDTWHHVDLLFDFNTQTYTFTLDGTLLASNVAFCGDNGPCAGGHVNSYGNGFFDAFSDPSQNDVGYLDNYSVSDVPEPSSILLLGSGLAGALGRLRRKLNQ